MVDVEPFDIQEIRLPSGFTSVHEYVKTLIAFLKQYEWLSELHVVDFFTHRHWDLLDPEWREALLLPTLENNNDEALFDTWLDDLLAMPDFDYCVVTKEMFQIHHPFKYLIVLKRNPVGRNHCKIMYAKRMNWHYQDMLRKKKVCETYI